MSLYSTETVKNIAESVGISLKEDVANLLVQDLEYRIREIIHEASKFMKHSNRRKLNTSDINYALKVKNVEPVYGFNTIAQTHWKMAHVGSQKLFFLDEKEIDLDEIIYQPLPPVPLDVVYTAHWLAIEGVQPSIPQNPTAGEIRAIEAGLLKAGVKFQDLIPSTQGVDTDALVNSVLSKELQLYYQKITESIQSQNMDVSKSAIESLEKDPGIQSLLPYFLQFISDSITKQLKDFMLVWGVLRMIKALLSNKNIFIEPYLHQLMPIIITCIVAKKIGGPTDSHWELRDFACLLSSYICETYGTSYPTLQPRVTKTLLRAFLDPLKSHSTHYGSIVGLSALGPQVIKMLIIPHVKLFGESLRPDLESGNETFTDALQCKKSILHAIQLYIKNEKTKSLKFSIGDQEAIQLFGIFKDDAVKYL